MNHNTFLRSRVIVLGIFIAIITAGIVTSASYAYAAAPVISSVVVTATSSAATFTWTTDQSSDTRVSIGTTTSYTIATTSPQLLTSHSMTVTGLTASTTYHYQIGSTNASSTLATTTDATFNTIQDTTPPVLSGPAGGPTYTSFTADWVTDEAANARLVIGVGTSSPYTLATSSAVYETGHALYIIGLSSGTTYHWQYSSSDPYGNTSSSTDAVFTTPIPDVTPPVVTITSPLSNSYNTGIITLSASSSDNINLQGVTFFVDGVAKSSELAGAQVSYQLDTSSLSNGSHVAAAVARDSSNNFATSTVTFNVGAQPYYGGVSGSSSGGSSGGGGVSLQAHTVQPTRVPATFNLNSSAASNTSGAAKIKGTLSYKSRNNSVKILQTLLGADTSLNYTGGVTGYYGRATQTAVEAFQLQKGIVKPGIAGYGIVGPKTRLALIAAYGI